MLPSIAFVSQFALLWLSAQVHANASKFSCAEAGTSPPYNASKTYLGCYTDRSVSILNQAKISTIAMTPQFCANFCGKKGYGYGGINFGTQCFCGVKPNYNAGKLANDSICNSPCVTEPSSSCGASYVLSLYQIDNPLSTNDTSYTTGFVPACQTSPLCSQKICDTSLSIDERVSSLVNSFTLEEKRLNLVDSSAGSTRLGLPSYEWWNEALHGIASSPGSLFAPAGQNFSYSTSFGSPILTAAAFDDALVSDVAKVVGKEARAFANYGYSEGFDFWTPDINPFREPRWGRGQETPGEDAFHVQRYVQNLIPGLQGDNLEDKQIIATCKHYSAYDVETGRYGNNYNPSQQDLADYFLAPFKTCVRDVKVGSVMCSYNAVDGIPSCANEYLLEDVLRKHWNFTADYNYVVSDCSAVQFIHIDHNFTNSLADAAAVAINAGTDLDCGQTYVALNTSLATNATTMATMDRALNRLYRALFTVGYFDGSSEYSSLSASDVGTPEATQLAYKAAVEGITLLKNDGTLPIIRSEKKIRVALIGPFANATSQMQGNYYGRAKHLTSPLEALQKTWNVTYTLGTGVSSTNTSGFAAALSAARESDLIFFFGGIDNTLESEELDRKSISWPGNQLDLISELSKLGKPLIVVQFGGGQVDDSAILANNKVNALLWVGYPGQNGGTAIRDIITGDASVAGRLPITQYPASYADEVSIFDIRLRPSANDSFPGRTYKWYNGKPVLPFGYGLHYTEFNFSWESTLKPSYDISSIVSHNSNDVTPFANITAIVKNIGKYKSDYVGLLFLSSSDAGPAPRPNKSLVSYDRLHDIEGSSTQKLHLPLALGSLARADENGDITIFPGNYVLALDIDEKIKFEFSLTGKKAIIDTLPRLAASYNFTVPVNIQPPSTSAAPNTS